jgi:hypothetical protein
MQAYVCASVHRIHRTTHRAVAYVPSRELESVRRKHDSRGARSPTPSWEEVKDHEEDDNPMSPDSEEAQQEIETWTRFAICPS